MIFYLTFVPQQCVAGELCGSYTGFQIPDKNRGGGFTRP
jgi:hypothetical protein